MIDFLLIFAYFWLLEFPKTTINQMALLNINIILPHISVATAAIFAVLLNVELRMVLLYEEGFSFVELFLIRVV